VILAGLRVVEVEGLGPAPFAAMWLADLGAEVTVIHRPAPPLPGFPDPNPLDRGKRSVVLDLKRAEDLAVARALIAGADVLIEGMRPGVMERLGLGPEPMQALNPRLVYGRMTGWGQTGPLAQTAGHDLAYLARSGAAWYASPPGAPPFPPPTLVGDMGGGAAYLVVGVLAGVIAARATGRGTVVDAAIVDGSAHLMALLMALRAGGAFAEARGQSLLDGPPWSRCYPCADGWMAVQALEPAFYAALIERLGLADDPVMAGQHDRAQWPAQAGRLAAAFATRTRAAWDAVFAGSDACVAPVLSPAEAAADPHLAARQTWVTADGTLAPAPAPRFGGAAPTARPAPRRGADNATVRAEIARRLADSGQFP
jgi:crotonobetainyl-CoA:carnitine CoA-transferase CaiB-like acyl-CoA transferase